MLIIWICEHKLPEFEGKKNRMTVHVDDFLIVAGIDRDGMQDSHGGIRPALRRARCPHLCREE